MTQAFDELAAQRDPLYAALKPLDAFEQALKWDKMSATEWSRRHKKVERRDKYARDAALLTLAIRALRNETL